MSLSPSRAEIRSDLAHKVARWPDETFRRHGITRCGEVTRLDHVGIPVWTAVRPLSRTISITAGKNLDKTSAKAGALIEGIEFGVSEQPTGEWRFIPKDGAGGKFMDRSQMPLTADSLYKETMPIAWEEAFHLNDRSRWWVPSDLVWMVPRVLQPFDSFQMSSSGIATGYSPADATLQGLYELVERDGWALSEFASEKIGKHPGRVDLSHAEGELAESIDRIRSAGIELFVFDLTREFGIPVMGATLFDPGLDNPGAYGGYGCSFDGIQAVNRAVMEAVQSRACYISGARDDMFRHQFLLGRQADPVRDIRVIQGYPETTSLSDMPRSGHLLPDAELSDLLERLKDFGVYDVWVKPLGKVEAEGDALHVVRVIASGLEPHRGEQWAPSDRAWKDLERILHE